MSVEIDIACPDRTFMGYLAMPDKKVGAGIVLIHEGFGLTSYMRALADKLSARLDMFVLIPDLLWRQQPCLELKETSEADQTRAAGLVANMDMDLALEDIQATITALREVGGCTGRIGVVGFGMGGVPAYLTAVKTDSNATVAYDASGLAPHFNEAIKITNPLLLHVPSENPNPSYMPQLSSALEDYMMVTFHEYVGTSDSFFRRSSANYNEEAAETAYKRTVEFLAANLAF